MASIRITQFAGLMPEKHAKLISASHAQIAHNCLLMDGKLRPYAKWVEVDARSEYWGQPYASLVYSAAHGKPFPYPAHDAVGVDGAPFPERTVVGPWLTNSAYYNHELSRWDDGAIEPRGRVNLTYGDMSGYVTYTRAYDSIKPINRIYAASYARRYKNMVEEGPLSIIAPQEQSATAVLYEGDLVNVTLYPGGNNGETHVRLYRSVTGLDTGQTVTNELDTNWHLVAELPLGGNVQYIDGASATALPLDVYYANSFYPLELKASYFGLTDSGWFVAATVTGDIQVSERYLQHAWPPENQFKIPAKVTDMVTHGDNAYFGTDEKPYIMAISYGEKAMQGRVEQYKEFMPCLPGTMTATATGAMYASGAGLVSLTRDGMEVVTRDIANAGNIFAKRRQLTGSAYDPEYKLVNVSFGDTAFGYYHQGRYYGFCYAPEPVETYGES